MIQRPNLLVSRIQERLDDTAIPVGGLAEDTVLASAHVLDTAEFPA